MKLIDVINKVCSPRRGIKPNFSRYHVLASLLELMKGPIGRIELSKKLGIGEASSRTLLRRLRELGLVKVDKVAGAVITGLGRKLVNEFLNRLRLLGEINIDEFYRDLKGYALILKDGDKLLRKIGGVLKIRDLFVRYGAEGAIILCFKDSKILMPLPSGYEVLNPNLNIYNSLSRAGLEDGDVILICVCKDSSKCPTIATEAAFEILASLEE